MSQLYRTRLSRHLKKMMKYMQYVFNDHFVIVCVFMLGGLGFYYSEVLKSLPQGFVWGRPLLLIIWLATLMIGKLATLTQEADKVFILPKESEMPAYLQRALSHSAILPGVAILLITGMTMPLVVVSTGQTFVTFVYYLLMLLLLKGAHLKWQEFDLYQLPKNKRRQWQLIWLLSSVAAIALALYLLPLAGLIAGAVVFGLFVVLLPKSKENASLDWEGMIKKENNRMHQIYRFINLFTDVPEITGNIKRRKIFDPLLNAIKKDNKNTYLYLYSRSFLRGSEYSGLYLRLLLLGGIVVYLSNDFIMALVVGLVFVYLMGFQLIPIYSQFDYMVMTQLFPTPATQKKQAVSFLLLFLLFSAVVIFGLLALIALPSIQEGLLVLAALAAEVVIFTLLYVPQRLKKMEG